MNGVRNSPVGGVRFCVERPAHADTASANYTDSRAIDFIFSLPEVSSMAFRVLVPALLCVLTASCAAQSAPAAAEKPEAKVDALFQKMGTTLSPGCALSVIRDHKIIYERGYGMADLDHNIPITPTTVFHVASMSKQFTAASILLLVQEGKLSLDDPVRKTIPELPDFGTPVTIRELLHHTSGLRDQWDLLQLSGWRYAQDLITDGDVLYVVSHQRDLNFPPNTKFLYSNTGYTLLAQIVARVSGESLRSFTTARIFAPLGMKSTHFRDDFDEIVKNLAYGYLPFGDTYHLSVTNFDTVGATSLLTTVEDLAQWDENFYTSRVGGPVVIQQLQERGRLDDGEQLDYAAGLVVSKYRGLNVVDHGGADAGYRADMIRFPDQHFSVACLCNLGSVNPADLAQKVAEVYLGSAMQPADSAKADDSKPIALTTAQMQAKAGVYLNVKDPDDLVRFVIKDGKLEVGNVGEDDTYEVKPFSENQFRVAIAPDEMTFSPPKPGAPLQLAIKHGDGKIETFSAAPAFAPTDAQLAEYAGVYSSAEIDPVYEMKIESGADGKKSLVLHRLKNGPDTLHPVTRDFFLADVGKIRFTRDSKGVINGFLLSTGRVIDLRFVRGRPAIPAR
jgi:CubicO group peptidase (beta-lactamase class C family)